LQPISFKSDRLLDSSGPAGRQPVNTGNARSLVELEEKKMSAKIGPLIFQLFSGCVDHPQQLRKPRVDAFDKPHIVERNNDPSRSMSVDFPVGQSADGLCGQLPGPPQIAHRKSPAASNISQYCSGLHIGFTTHLSALSGM